MRHWWFFTEVIKAARAQRVGPWLIAIVSGLSVLVPMATAGQTDALENSILSGLESRANRTLTVTRNSEESLSREALEKVGAVSLVETTYGLGRVTDYYNAAFSQRGSRQQGAPVAVVPFMGDLSDMATIVQGREPQSGETVVTQPAMRVLGLEYPAGALVENSIRRRLRDDPRGDTAVVGQLRFVNGASRGETIGVRVATDDDELMTLVVVADSFRNVTRLEPILRAVIGVDPGDVRVDSTAEFESTLAAITGRVGQFSRALTLISVGVGMTFLSLIVYGILQGQKRDFGRRRALGASRPVLVAMVALQTLVVAIPGCVAGALAGWFTANMLSGAPPSLTFGLDVTVLGLLAAIAAAIPPAILAALRDPVAALRVP